MTTTYIAPPTVQLFITGRLGIVHRMQDGVTCSAGQRAYMRKFVTPVQAFYYRLTPCGRPVCFPDARVFEQIVGRRAA